MRSSSTEIDVFEIGSVIFINAEADLSEFVRTYNIFNSYCESITIYGDENDIALYWAEIFNYMSSKKSERNYFKSLGRSVSEPLRDIGGNVLDIDIINTSTLHGNVTGTRHCYFDLSREMVEDIRELIVNRIRARLRHSRLIMREGNLFDFLIAPSYVFH
jgi:hypothetical protein